MTKEKMEMLKELGAKAEKDEALKTALKEASVANDIEKIIEIAAEQGYTFEASDFEVKEGDEKLDPAELQAVAGGKGEVAGLLCGILVGYAFVAAAYGVHPAAAVGLKDW